MGNRRMPAHQPPASAIFMRALAVPAAHGGAAGTGVVGAGDASATVGADSDAGAPSETQRRSRGPGLLGNALDRIPLREQLLVGHRLMHCRVEQLERPTAVAGS